MRRVLVPLGLVWALGLGGCVIHGRHGTTVLVPGHIGVRVSVPHHHVHSAHCGHYYHGGHWYHAHGHVHGPGCGHRFSGGMWIVVAN